MSTQNLFDYNGNGLNVLSNRYCKKCNTQLYTDGHIAIATPPSMLYWCKKCNVYRYLS